MTICPFSPTVAVHAYFPLGFGISVSSLLVKYDLLYKSYHILLFPSIEKNIFLSVFSDFSIENL